jgi:hypothetical protein
MPTLRLNLDELAVESFDPAPPALPVDAARPRTFEPGCTLPEICGTTG